MTSAAIEAIRTVLRAWADGDLEPLAAVLDPRAELRGYGAGEWDCVGRDEVLEVLRNSRPAKGLIDAMQVVGVDDHHFVVAQSDGSPTDRHGVSVPPELRFTRVTLVHGAVTHIQQFATRSAAICGPDPVAEAAILAVRAGDVEALEQLLADQPHLATARLQNHGDRTLLHVATDWPGHFPRVASTIAVLIAAGADVNAPSIGDHSETALHWAASSDDIEALDALLDAGADIEAFGAVIGGGTALSDATAFAQWAAARRLIERGAVPQFWEAAALGLLTPLRERLDARAVTSEDITHAFWCACHGNQQEAAILLLARGADINWVGYDNLSPIQAALRSGGAELAEWVRRHGGRPAGELPA